MGAARIIGVVAMISVAVVGTRRWRGAESDWRTRFTQAALQIPFDTALPPERDTLLRSDERVPKGFLRFRIAAARTRDTARAGGIAFRITSDTAYPRLGIVQGVNYVWKDVASGKTRFLMIPADTAKPPHWLVVSSHAHPPTKVTGRLVLAMGAGKPRAIQSARVLNAEVLICGECDTGWCTARDTTRNLADLKSTPVASITRYFERNHVAFLQR